MGGVKDKRKQALATEVDPRSLLSRDETRDSLYNRSSAAFAAVRAAKNEEEKKDIFLKFLEAEETGTKNNDAPFTEFPDGMMRSRSATACFSYSPDYLEWFNVAGPLRMDRELKGKIVFLDFWTYCCVNCMHVLPDLEALEEKYETEPAVSFIGVHAGKFAAERDGVNIRNAILRHHIKHPVPNDADLQMVDALGVRCWPTFVVFGPRGNRIAHFIDDDTDINTSDLFLKTAIQFFQEQGTHLNRRPIALRPESECNQSEADKERMASPLDHPCKVSADSQYTGNNRIIVTDLQGNFQYQIGSGLKGLSDGTASQCSFNLPNGLYFNSSKNTLYIADSDNHAVRAFSPETKTVRTIAGNGRRFPDPRINCLPIAGHAAKQMLSSPWDIVVDDKLQRLYIAIAGVHEIWFIDLADDTIHNLSGNGQEKNLNHPSDLLESAWAQPSGISLCPTSSGGQALAVADSESSTVRAILLDEKRSITLAGGTDDPNNLFAFGDCEGKGIEARFQHPLGVVWSDELNSIIVADSYNHRLKTVALDGTTRNWIGSGKAGCRDGNKPNEVQFFEPAGLALTQDGSILFVADSSNNAVRRVDVGSKIVTTLALKGVPKGGEIMTAKSEALTPAKTDFGRNGIGIGPVSLPKGVTEGKGLVKLSAIPPDGFHFTEGVPSRFSIMKKVDGAGIDVLFDSSASGDLSTMPSNEATITFNYKVDEAAYANNADGLVTRLLRLTCNYCKDGGVCAMNSTVFHLQFSLDQQFPSLSKGIVAHKNLPNPTE